VTNFFVDNENFHAAKMFLDEIIPNCNVYRSSDKTFVIIEIIVWVSCSSTLNIGSQKFTNLWIYRVNKKNVHATKYKLVVIIIVLLWCSK